VRAGLRTSQLKNKLQNKTKLQQEMNGNLA
jgi:hypothetical protein